MAGHLLPGPGTAAITGAVQAGPEGPAGLGGAEPDLRHPGTGFPYLRDLRRDRAAAATVAPAVQTMT